MLYVTGLALVAGAAIGFATGGRPRFIMQHKVRFGWLVVLGFGLQVVSGRIDRVTLATVAVLLGAGALLAFAALNPNLTGIGVVAVGVAANALVIGLNDGMPVHGAAVVAAGIASPAQVPSLDYGTRHRQEQPGDRLQFLDDRIPLPPFNEVLSFGDLILAVGVSDAVAHLLRKVPDHTTA